MYKINPSLQLPIQPKIEIIGIIPEKSLIFKSAKMPVKYTCKVASESQIFVKDRDDPSQYDIMFKYDDDLRKDQLILQMIEYMDTLLKSVGIDLEFTKYKVIATSKLDGYVEFVTDSTTVASVLSKNNNQIYPYLSRLTNVYGYNNRTLDSYITSSAGYCIVTYLLGIGDRHLDNILIDRKGRLFHIDFGYILGKDPKSFPPPIKLSSHMVECMGGKNSKGYEDFKKKCETAFIALRKYARLVVNMFYLMIHSEIDELKDDYELIINKMHERFCPNMTDEEAKKNLSDTLEESLNAKMAAIMDYAHYWATLMK